MRFALGRKGDIILILIRAPARWADAALFAEEIVEDVIPGESGENEGRRACSLSALVFS